GPRRCLPPAPTPTCRCGVALAPRRLPRRRELRRAISMPDVLAVMALGARDPSIAGRVFLAGRPQVAAVVVGPQLVLEDELGIRRLPQHEIAGPPLPPRPEKKSGHGGCWAGAMGG